ncbi:MAG: hydantoinase B/oxoprolinase family protein, partial [Rhodospirillales bacterium]|nr:hydantoinase B/oxoprolinase family protein [Rhodospirillales bacterium]
ALRPDSGGAGAQRGGLGAIYEIELIEEQADVFLFGERGKFAPPGVVGGAAGALNRFVYPDGNTTRSPPMASKLVGLSIRKGQRLLLETPGGGGYGDPGKRPVAAVRHDVRLGYVTPGAALAQYRVAIDAGGAVDEGRTDALRGAAKE